MNFSVNILSIINLLLILTIAVFVVLFYISKLKKDNVVTVVHETIGVKEASLFDVVIMQILCKAQMETNSSKVVLARFHNGGAFSNGIDMKKFTVTHETPGGGKEPLMDKMMGRFNSRYPSTILQLSTCDYFCLSDINDSVDNAFKKDMEYYGFNSANLFMIRQLGIGAAEGFVGVFFKYTNVMNLEAREKITLKIPRLLNLVNQKEIALKD